MNLDTKISDNALRCHYAIEANIQGCRCKSRNGYKPGAEKKEIE
jgi:hypothetical protein